MMRDQLSKRRRASLAVALGALFCLLVAAQGQAPNQRDGDKDGGSSSGARARKNETRGSVRSVTIPVTIQRRGSNAPREEIQTLELVVREDGEPQELLAARGADRLPLALAVLIQDDVQSPVSNEINGLAAFIRSLPAGSRVMVGYLRAGSPQIKQRFTNDLERAAKALRIPIGAAAIAPFNPYVELADALKRFESLPTGRRAVLLVSDGVDVSRGVESSTPEQSVDLQRALNEAQRRSVAVYSIYAPTSTTAGGNFNLIGNGQSSLQRLSEETGGRAFFQGTSAPVSFDPFLRELTGLLNRQFALTYLSTHPSKEFHRIKLQTSQTDLELAYPAGYTRK